MALKRKSCSNILGLTRLTGNMTVYKKIIIKMQRFTSLQVLYVFVVEFWNSVSSNDWISHHLQYKISSKGFENLDWKWIVDVPVLWALGWYCIKYRNDSLKEIIAQAQEHFQTPISVNIFHHAFIMQVKALSCKRETICERDPEMLLPSLGQSSFKMDWGQVKNCSGVRRPEIILGKHGPC